MRATYFLGCRIPYQQHSTFLDRDCCDLDEGADFVVLRFCLSDFAPLSHRHGHPTISLLFCCFPRRVLTRIILTSLSDDG